MPIQCLATIQFSSLQQLTHFDLDESLVDYIEGVYQFDLAALGPNISLFSDGFPAIMLMPDSSSSSVCQVGKQQVELGSIWLSAGIVKNATWTPNIEHGLLTIVRFYPHAWSSLMGRNAIQNPFVHDLFHYAPTLADDLKKMYLSSTITEGLQETLKNWIKKRMQKHVPRAVQSQVYKKEWCVLAYHSSNQELHPKQIQRQFKKYIGLAPYQYLQLQRFIKAFFLMTSSIEWNLHSIAVQCNYYDANHVVKDFKKYLGYSPRHFFQNKLQQ
ncbi:helix-turn-helix domain-containing protein [Sphingobacterium sp. LRF_L2]|uniref:helix-turn-helix domain-containing protein n=1 Tax=Sphingobacterium sp. LRF_L2 TaxID=3369421 RepID=UPI003F6315F4